jgi:RNA polymerase sigma factor (sigma-70 family)
VQDTQPGSLEQIYREQYRPLVAFLFQRLRDRGRAEDLAQEVFVRALRHRPDNARAWLYTVAANLARDEGRRRTVRLGHLRLVQSEASSATQSATPTALAALEQQEQAARVEQALAALDARDRDALLLKERGLSYDEIAAELGLSKGSVGTTLSRARQRLAAAWTELSGDGGTP